MERRDVLAAIREARDNLNRQRGLFVPLSEARPYLEDKQFVAAAALELAALIGADAKISSNKAMCALGFSCAIRFTAFARDGEILRPVWPEGETSAAKLNSHLMMLVAEGLIWPGYCKEDFRPRLFPGEPVMRFPLMALEAAEAGIEARRCVECQSWMMHTRAGASFCSTTCSGRARAKRHRAKLSGG